MEILLITFIFLCWLVCLVASTRRILREWDLGWRLRRLRSYVVRLRARLAGRREKLARRMKALGIKNRELEALKKEIIKTKKEIDITGRIAVAEIELERALERLEQLNRIRRQSLHLETKR